jgi:dihydroxyacetone kinase-like protein
MKTKKLINAPDQVVDQMVEGIVMAHPDHLRLVDGNTRAVAGTHAPRQGKVGIVIGGGSGHEPAFLGYVGRGLADAAPIGNVFAAPPPDPIQACTRAADGGAGVVYLYGNYQGDVMNFDMAAEMVELEGIQTRTVLVTDDVASAPRDRRQDRRGVAGDVIVFKAAGAAADQGYDLDQTAQAAERANQATLTMGVALAPCSLPATREANFELGPEEMEIGLGVHGEPGVDRGPLKSADEVADDLIDRILAELDAERGQRVQVLVNGLGATPRMELYLLYRRTKQRLDDAGLVIARAMVGDYVTSLEMAGASITIVKLDDELERLLSHSADCAMFQQSGPAA